MLVDLWLTSWNFTSYQIYTPSRLFLFVIGEAFQSFLTRGLPQASWLRLKNKNKNKQTNKKHHAESKILSKFKIVLGMNPDVPLTEWHFTLKRVILRKKSHSSFFLFCEWIAPFRMKFSVILSLIVHIYCSFRYNLEFL